MNTMNRQYIAHGKLYTFDNVMNLSVTDAPAVANGNRADRIIVRWGVITIIAVIAAIFQEWV